MLSKLLLQLGSLGIFCLALFGVGFLKGRASQQIKNIKQHNKILQKRIDKTKKIIEQRKIINNGGRPARSKFLRKNGFVKNI